MCILYIDEVGMFPEEEKWPAKILVGTPIKKLKLRHIHCIH